MSASGKSTWSRASRSALDGYEVVAGAPFFKEFVVRCPQPVALTNQFLLDEYGIVGGYDLGQDYPQLAGHMLLCVTEMNSRGEIELLAEALAEIGDPSTAQRFAQDDSHEDEEVAND